jgi:hypothetical protein
MSRLPLIPAIFAATLMPVMSAKASSESFSAEDILDWSTRSFDGETRYRRVEQNGQTVVEARSRGQASAKYLEREIDLTDTPYLRWCWRVSAIHEGLEETTQAGDDYPARVYVARKAGLMPWQVQSVNYVWSSTQSAGSDWPNAFTSRAHLLALQGGEARVGEWVGEVRDVREDFARYFDASPDHIDGVALMSDGDNAGVDATAWYANLAFTEDDTPPECP